MSSDLVLCFERKIVVYYIVDPAMPALCVRISYVLDKNGCSLLKWNLLFVLSVCPLSFKVEDFALTSRMISKDMHKQSIVCKVELW